MSDILLEKDSSVKYYFCCIEYFIKSKVVKKSFNCLTKRHPFSYLVELRDKNGETFEDITLTFYKEISEEEYLLYKDEINSK